MKGRLIGFTILLLLCASIPIVTAMPSYTQLQFRSIMTGNGLVAWGYSWIPDHDEETGEQTLVYGDIEYFQNSTSLFVLCGKGEIWDYEAYNDPVDPEVYIT